MAAPIPWFSALAGQHDPIALLSQYFGSAALIVMAISQLLATRFRVLEVIFGGLDRIYVLHKWLGISALAFILRPFALTDPAGLYVLAFCVIGILSYL